MDEARADRNLLTQDMENFVDESMNELVSYYCREDLQDALESFKKSSDGQKIVHSRNLRAICLARGLDIKRFCEDAVYRKEAIKETPTQKELLDKLLSLLYGITQRAPAPDDIMGRIVRRLATESAQDDSVRLAILKQFVVKCGFDCKTISIAPVVDWAKARMSKEELHSYEQLVPKEEKLRRIAAKLDDSIFEVSRPDVSFSAPEILKLMLKRVDKLQERIRKMNPKDPDVKYENGEAVELADIPMSDDAHRAMRDFCEQHGLPCEQDATALELMRTISAAFEGGRLASDASMTFFDELKRAYGEELKKFSCRTRNGGWTTAKSMFEDDQRDERKRKKNAAAISGNEGGGKLVELCDDFARGRFANNNGKTRIYLFWFALVFGMTVEFFDPSKRDDRTSKRDDRTSKRDDRTDMVKNLFEDYYNDNLLRYLRKEEIGRDQESEPSGAGLNFKNYTEAIYLYYVSRKEDPRTPGERIDAAEMAIKCCYEEAKRKRKAGKTAGESPLAPSDSEPTKTFRDRYEKQILDCKEEELVGRIVCNYRILKDSDAVSRVMVSARTNTAFSLLEEALDKWESDYDYNYLEDVLADDLRRTSISIDTELYGYAKKKRYAKKKQEAHLAGKDEKRAVAAEDFIRVVEHLHSRMSAEFGGVSSRQSHFLLYLLRALALTSQDGPVEAATLEKALFRYDIVADGDRIGSGAKLLERAGFAVEIDSSKKQRYYRLVPSDYADQRMQTVMRWANLNNNMNATDAVEQRFYALLKETVSPDERRITRSAFIVQLANAYVAQLPEKSILSFPGLYRDFVDHFNPKLIEARFQPISTKNVLDMYVLISIFFYTAKNGVENERDYLREEQIILLYPNQDCKEGEKYKVTAYQDENNSAVRYRAKRVQDSRAGILEEFYPYDLAAEDEDSKHYYTLERLGDGVLIPTRGMGEDFQEKCQAYIDRARKERVAGADALYSAWREDGEFCAGSVYLWISDPKTER